jgi:hypothetical protein
MPDDEVPPKPESLGEASRQMIEASKQVTALLLKMASGEAVDPKEFEDARKAELLTSARYSAFLAGDLIMKGHGGTAAPDPQ